MWSCQRWKQVNQGQEGDGGLKLEVGGPKGLASTEVPTPSSHGLLKAALVEIGAGAARGDAVASPPRSSWARTCRSSFAASNGWARKTEEYFQMSSSTTSLTERMTEGDGSEM